MGISASEYQRRLQKLLNKSVLDRFVDEIVFDDESELKKEKIDEFESGLRPSGRIIGKYRSVAYAVKKFNQNPKAQGNVDLILEGKFSGRLFLKKFKKRSYIFDSSDSKTQKLVDKYGKDILGLNAETFRDKQIKEYAKELLKEMKAYARIR
jgi:hypothetical protein